MNKDNNHLEKKINISFKTKSIYSISVLCLGLLLGLVAKYADNYFFIGDLTTNVGVWIFIATLILIYSYTPIHACVNNFLFFIGLLTTYYLYSYYLFNSLPINYIKYWLIITIISSIGSYFIWYANSNNRFSVILASISPILLILDGYSFYYTFKPVSGLSLIFAIILVILTAKTTKQRYQTIFITLTVSLILIVILRIDIFSSLYSLFN